MKYICAPSSFIRGWGWPAVECTEDDPDAVCHMHGDETKWLKPANKVLFACWKIAGSPTDEDSLRNFGAGPVDPARVS